MLSAQFSQPRVGRSHYSLGSDVFVRGGKNGGHTCRGRLKENNAVAFRLVVEDGNSGASYELEALVRVWKSLLLPLDLWCRQEEGRGNVQQRYSVCVVCPFFVRRTAGCECILYAYYVTPNKKPAIIVRRSIDNALCESVLPSSRRWS